jgi:general secretion pathway protein C
MARYVSWVVNLGLLALSCWFVAQAALLLIDAWASPLPSGDALDLAQPSAAAGSPADPQLILTRNLFNASLLAPQTPIAVVDEVLDLEATKLPLTLLGTAASDDLALSWAAIQDRESQQTLVLRHDDTIRNQAKVVRIERKRVVLDEGGALRELALEEAEGPTVAVLPAAAARANARRGARAQPQPPAETPAPATARTPAQLFQDARILPKYAEGQMVGVQVSSIKPGGIFEKMGLQDGDVITELNGVRIDSPEQSAKILLQLSGTDTFTLQVDRAGGPTTMNVNLAAEP